MKTTKQDFQDFRRYAEEYIAKLGLTNWSVHFSHKKTGECYAQTVSEVNGKVATIFFSTSWDNLRLKNERELRRLALHEVLHVLLSPMMKESKERYTMPYVIDDLEHDVIRRLEGLS